MKQITIRSITLEGFRSYTTPVTFQFNTTGLHLIKGDNGEGKTTIFSALYWVMYKQNLNDTNNDKVATWKHMRTTEFKGTRVIVYFGVGRYKYMVARHLHYKGKTAGVVGENHLMIFRKEKVDKEKFNSSHQINDELYKADQQAYLIKILGIDAKTFVNSVIFGQRMARLMSSKDADKRNLFESLFDVDFIDELKKNANSKHSELSTKILRYTNEKEVLDSKVTLLTRQLATANNVHAEFKEQRSARLKAFKEQAAHKLEELASTQQLVEVAKKKAAKADKTNVLEVLIQDADTKREANAAAKQRLSNVKQDIADYERQYTASEVRLNNWATTLQQVKDTCPTCGGPLSVETVAKSRKVILDNIQQEKDIKKSIASKITKYQQSQENLQLEVNSSLKEFTAAMDAYNEAKQHVTINNSNTELLALEQKARLLQQSIDNIKANFEAERARKPPEMDIAAMEVELAECNESLPDYEAAISKGNKLLARYTWWIKNAFGSDGLKAYIFSAMLNRLNECLSVYTAYFGYTVAFGIDLTKATKPFYGKVMLDGVNDVDYQELSGGQKQKIDVCIAFAMHDMVATKSIFNILLLDEVTEGLDIEAQEMVDTLIRIKAETKAVYIISHSPMMDYSGVVEYTVQGGNKTKSTIA